MKYKPDGTPVSQADIEIERSLVDLLARHRPGDAVLGEELGALGDSSRR
jgi:histidinol-phosphatase